MAAAAFHGSETLISRCRTFCNTTGVSLNSVRKERQNSARPRFGWSGTALGWFYGDERCEVGRFARRGSEVPRAGCGVARLRDPKCRNPATSLLTFARFVPARGGGFRHVDLLDEAGHLAARVRFLDEVD